MHLDRVEWENTRPATEDELVYFARNWDLSRWEFRVSIDDGPHPRWWITQRDRENS